MRGITKRFSSNQRVQNIGIRVISQARKWNLIPHFPVISDRAIEYGFIMRELDLQEGKVLDVGFCESPLPFILAGLQCYEVYGIDIRQFPIEYPGLQTSVQDIRQTTFPDRFFDRIMAVSTIEHLGLAGRYGSYDDINADSKAVSEMTRILKDNGRILITVPFGMASIDHIQRIYDDKSLEDLFSGLRIEKKEYAKQLGEYWAPATYEEVKKTQGYHAVVLLSLSK